MVCRGSAASQRVAEGSAARTRSALPAERRRPRGWTRRVPGAMVQIRSVELEERRIRSGRCPVLAGAAARWTGAERASHHGELGPAFLRQSALPRAARAGRIGRRCSRVGSMHARRRPAPPLPHHDRDHRALRARGGLATRQRRASTRRPRSRWGTAVGKRTTSRRRRGLR